MSKEAMKLALEALEGMYIQGFTQDDSPINNAITALREALAEPDFWEGYVPEPVKPAQQEPKIDIYRSFEQWKRGNVLEHGVPRTEHYSEAQLDLVEMGWRYGYDAGRAVEQALDKKAENARELGLDYEPAQHHSKAWPPSHWTDYERSIAAAEREACAKFADQYMRDLEGKSFGVGDAIRARSNT